MLAAAPVSRSKKHQQLRQERKDYVAHIALAREVYELAQQARHSVTHAQYRANKFVDMGRGVSELRRVANLEGNFYLTELGIGRLRRRSLLSKVIEPIDHKTLENEMGSILKQMRTELRELISKASRAGTLSSG